MFSSRNPQTLSLKQNNPTQFGMFPEQGGFEFVVESQLSKATVFVNDFLNFISASASEYMAFADVHQLDDINIDANTNTITLPLTKLNHSVSFTFMNGARTTEAERAPIFTLPIRITMIVVSPSFLLLFFIIIIIFYYYTAPSLIISGQRGQWWWNCWD